MAKNKKSKILAMALCASVMTGIYASPVMAAELYEYNNDSQWVTTKGDKGTKITSLEGLKEIKVGTATDDNGLVKVSDDNGGLVRVGESGGQNVRVTSDGIYLNNNGVVRTSGLTANALTLEGNILTSAQLANINSVIGENGVINAGAMNIEGADGGLYVQDIGGQTMILARPKGEYSTLRIDPTYGNLSTKGSIAVVGKNGSWDAPTTIIDGKTGNVAVGSQIHLNAVDGAVTASTYNGVKLATDGNKVEVGGYNVAQMSTDIDDVKGKSGGIRRAGTTDENRSTYIEETVQVNNNGGLAVLDKERNVVARVDRSGRANFTALTVDGNITSGGALTVKNGNGTASLSSTALNIGNAVTVRNDGIARFGALEDANVRMEDGVLTVNSTGETDVAKLDAQGLTLTSGATEATLSAEQIARLNKVVTQNGESIVVTADHFKNTKESFAVDSNGAVKAANGKFNVGADGDVVIQYAKDGVIVADENGFAVQKGSAQAVVMNNGVGLAAGLKADGSAAARISVTDDGIGLQGGTSKVVLNSNNGAVFHNGEGSGHTLINGGSITTNRITTGTVNGVAIGMDDNGDITLGNNVVIDGDFNSDNIAGITRVDRNDSEPGSEVTYIEKNTAVSADGIVVTDQNTRVSTKTKYDGFYVKDATGNNVSRLTKDRLDLAGKILAVADSEGNIDVSASTYTAGDATTENVRVKADGIYVKDGSTTVSSLKDDGLMLTDQESGKQTLNATDIADIKGIDRDIVEETFVDVTTTTKTTTIEGALKVSDNGFISNANESFTVDANGTLTAAGGRFTVSDVTGAHFYGSDSMFSDYTNINGGRIEINGADGSQTVINGGSVTTGTITADDLHVDNIYLGNQIVDEEGNVVGSDLAIGADGSIKIADNFEVDTDNLAAHYGEYELTLDGNSGFALGNSKATLTLNDKGYAFSGSVNLGAASDVKFGYTGKLGGYTASSYSLSQLVDTVNDIYDRTSGIYKDADGNTVVTDGTWNAESKEMEDANSSITVGKDGATFESTTNEGTTNINGSEIVSDATNVESGSGSGSGFGGGTSTTNGDNAVYVGEDGDYTHVSSDGVTIGDKTNTNTTNIDKYGMVVDGEKGNTHISEGGMTVTDKTDNSTTNIDGNGMVVDGSNGTTHISDSGMTVTGDNGTTNISGGDISVDNSVTVGSGENQTVVNNDGVTVGGDKGTSIKNDSISVGDGGYIGDGDVRSGEGVSLNQTAERVGHLENRVGKLEDRIDKVGAMAAAIANLRTMGYDPAAPTEVAVGIGQYRDETGAALGLFHYPNRDFMLSLSVSTSGDEVMGGIGATWKFGRKSPEKVAEIKKAQAEADARRAEEAKLAKAEEMKQAAKEAKIKAQQERHAKLAAERAAQAEAAK